MIKNILQKKPSEIASAARAVLAACVLVGWANLDTTQLAGIVLALESVLYLFTSSQTVSVGVLHEANTTKTEVLDAVSVNNDPGNPQTITMRGIASTPTPEPRSRPSYRDSIVRMALLVLALTSVACGTRQGPATAPHVAAAQYGTDAMQITIALQDAVIAYSKANGGNETTDAIMRSIRERVIPTANQLSATLKAYDAITDPALRASRIGEIDHVLVSLVTAYGEVSKNQGIATLASEAALASARIRELVLAVRVAIGLQTTSGQSLRFVPPRPAIA